MGASSGLPTRGGKVQKRNQFFFPEKLVGFKSVIDKDSKLLDFVCINESLRCTEEIGTTL